LVAGLKAMWDALTRNEQLHYEREASQYQEEVRESIKQKEAVFRAAIRSLKMRLRRRTEGGGTSLRLGLARLSAAQKTKFDEVFLF